MLSVVKWRFNNRKRRYPQAFPEPVCASFLFAHLAEDLKTGAFPRGQWAMETIKTLWLLRRPLQAVCHKQRRKMETTRLCSVERCWRDENKLVRNCLEGKGAYSSDTKEMLPWLPSWEFCSRTGQDFFNIYKFFGRNTLGFFCKVSNEGSENCHLVWENRENHVKVL